MIVLNQKDTKKTISILFGLGVLLFTVGILLYIIGYSVASPLVPSVTVNDVTYSIPFLNWVDLAGIVLAVIGVVVELAKRKNKN